MLFVSGKNRHLRWTSFSSGIMPFSSYCTRLVGLLWGFFRFTTKRKSSLNLELKNFQVICFFFIGAEMFCDNFVWWNGPISLQFSFCSLTLKVNASDKPALGILSQFIPFHTSKDFCINFYLFNKKFKLLLSFLLAMLFVKSY